MNESIKEQLESTFKTIVVTIPEDTRIVVNVKKDQILAVLRFLKDRRFDHLALVSCVDWIEEKEFELVYILTGYMQGDEEHTEQERLHLIIKTRISRQSPRLKTVTSVFSNAEPYEREIHELSFFLNQQQRGWQHTVAKAEGGRRKGICNPRIYSRIITAVWGKSIFP